MADENYQYCKIFVQGEARTAEDLLESLLGESFQDDLMTLPDAEIEVLRNPDAAVVDSFLGWPTLVEIEAEDDADNAAIVGITSAILTAAWDSGIPTVAACDFEDELPWRGGIGRINDDAAQA